MVSRGFFFKMDGRDDILIWMVQISSIGFLPYQNFESSCMEFNVIRINIWNIFINFMMSIYYNQFLELNPNTFI